MTKLNWTGNRGMKDSAGRWISTLVMAAVVTVAMGCSSPEQKAASYMKDGKDLFEKGKYVQAGLQFRNALQINDKNADAWVYLGKIDMRAQKWDQAYAELKRAISIDPKNTDALAELGALQLGANQLDDAMTTSKSLLKLAPKSAAAHTLRGAVMYRLQNLDQARDEAKAALDIDPGHVDALLLLARIDQTKGDSKAALAVIDGGLAKNPKNVPLQLVKIDILEAMNKTDEVVAAYKALIAQNPKERSYRNLLAAHYLKRKQTDQAQQVLEQTVQDFPDQVDAKLAVIRFAAQYMSPAKAIALAKGYVEKSPEDTELKFELGKLLVVDGKKDEGRKIFTELTKSDKDATVIEAQTALARLAVADGKTDEAQDWISKVLARDSKNSDALMLSAVLAMQQEKPGDAVGYLNTVLSDSPNSAKALMLLGQAYMLRGETELGKEQYYRAIEANPNNPTIPVAFANVLAQRQEYRQAENVLERFLSRQPTNVPALKEMASVKMHLQDWLGAQQVAEKLRNLKGGETVSQQIEGSVLQAQQKFGASNAVFRQLYSQNPDLQQPIAALVQNYMRSGKKDQAVSFLQEVLKTNPKNTTAQTLLGSVYETDGDTAKADDAFKAAIASAPESAQVRLRYAQALVLRGNRDQALKVLHDGLDLNSNDVVLMLGVAMVQQYAGNYDKAIAEYEELLKRQPGVDVAANNLASLLTDYHKDKASYQRALNLARRFKDSNIPYFLDTLGWVYYKLDQPSDALPLLKKAVKGAPNAAILRYHLALVQLKSGDKEAAKKNLEQVVNSGDKSFTDMKAAKETLKSL